jgi:inner membrane protein
MVDAMTVSGVPFGPYSNRRFHLFGGRFRTGDPVENAISFGIVALLVQFTYAAGWYPFFYDWGGMCSEGVIEVLSQRVHVSLNIYICVGCVPSK